MRLCLARSSVFSRAAVFFLASPADYISAARIAAITRRRNLTRFPGSSAAYRPASSPESSAGGLACPALPCPGGAPAEMPTGGRAAPHATRLASDAPASPTPVAAFWTRSLPSRLFGFGIAVAAFRTGIPPARLFGVRVAAAAFWTRASPSRLFGLRPPDCRRRTAAALKTRRTCRSARAPCPRPSDGTPTTTARRARPQTSRRLRSPISRLSR